MYLQGLPPSNPPGSLMSQSRVPLLLSKTKIGAKLKDCNKIHVCSTYPRCDNDTCFAWTFMTKLECLIYRQIIEHGRKRVSFIREFWSCINVCNVRLRCGWAETWAFKKLNQFEVKNLTIQNPLYKPYLAGRPCYVNLFRVGILRVKVFRCKLWSQFLRLSFQGTKFLLF